ncbi:MAG: response regulator, partial [Bacteroidota bacterium]
MLTSLIIEDSRLARKELVGLLADFPDIDIIGEAADGDGALRLIREKPPDLLFLDIDLPGKNGFELLGELSQLPLVIFTTAFDEYALRSFDYNAVDYLLKPIRKDRLARAIEKAKRSVHNADQVAKERLGLEHRIFVKDGERCWFVTLRDLRLLESVGNYCRLYFG